MTAKEYKSLGVAERRVFFISALVPVDIRKESDEDGTRAGRTPKQKIDIDAVRSGDCRRSQ